MAGQHDEARNARTPIPEDAASQTVGAERQIYPPTLLTTIRLLPM